MLEFFQSKGFSSPDHVKIISSYPWILKRSLEDQMVPAFDFLENLLQSLLLMMNDVFTP
jgi:mTERF domain-containing protein